MQVVQAVDLSIERFVRQYAEAGRPVVIDGLAGELFEGQQWDWAYVRKVLRLGEILSAVLPMQCCCDVDAPLC